MKKIKCSHKAHEWNLWKKNKKNKVIPNFPPTEYCRECEESIRLKGGKVDQR